MLVQPDIARAICDQLPGTGTNRNCQTIGTVIEQVEDVKVPWLLLHGSEDDVVSPQDSVDIKERLGDRVDHVVIDGADHSYNNEQRQAQLDAVVNWLIAQCA